MEGISAILSSAKLKQLASDWLTEDCPNFDLGAFVLGDKNGESRLLCKSPCILAGVPFFNAVFEVLNCKVTWNYKEGHVFSSTGSKFTPVHVATVTGNVRDILRGERPALNLMSRASGIALGCQKFVDQAKKHAWEGKIAATRKTTPGFRLVEKYSLLVGGADTHRYDLSSTVMLKDNHIWATGSIQKAVSQVHSVASFTTKIEVECQNIKEGLEAAEAGAHIVMFDNMTPEELHLAAKELKESFPHTIVECSGGVMEDNISEYFNENVDIISTSKLVQGYPAADFSLKIVKESVRDAAGAK